MPRLPRLILPDNPMHVIQRGNNRMPTFRSGDDFERYREVLHELSRRYRCAINAYVLMTNHVHLLVTPSDPHGLSRMMQTMGPRYVRYVNRRHERTGTLWEGRFKASIISSDRYLLTCSRYIELNPVRAQMVAAPEQYAWSSYRHNALGEVDAIVTESFLYRQLGLTQAERQDSYRALFQTAIDPRTIDSIRRATNHGAVLGDAAFCDRIEIMTGRRLIRAADLN